LVVDVSASMGNKLRQARQAVQRLAATIQAQDEVFLLAFSHRPGLLQDFTDSRALIVQATAQLQPDGGTALYDAILDGLQRMKTARRQKKALVVITDGLDTGSQASLEQVAATVRKADILVYTIGIGNPNGNVMRPHGGMGGRPYFGGMGGMSSGVFPHLGQGPIPPTRPQINEDTVDSRLLIMLSEETGAKHFLLNTADVLGQRAILENAAETIVMELRGQYSLGYRSALKGDIRRDVRVETRRPDLVVRTQAHPAGMQRTN
jgi:VWFA-related protein